MKKSQPNNNKRVAIIGTVGVPAKYGGFETLAHHLVEQLADKTDMTVYCSAKNYSKEERKETYKGAKLKYLPLSANGASSVLYDIISMIHALIFADVMIVLGVSGALFLPFVKLFSTKKVIVNVDGLEWRRAKWQGWAKKFLEISERIAVTVSDEIITDNEAIQKYVFDRYGLNSRLIEYGADHTSYVPLTNEIVEKYPFLAGDYAFKVCRIEPENNIKEVLVAFQNYEKMPLVMVGNWNHSAYSRSVYNEFKDVPNLFFLQPIYDSYLLNALRSNCKVYVHGHSAGGTNPSLVEAMHLGLPIIAFDVIYNRITMEHHGRFFENASDLQAQLAAISNAELFQLARTMESIARRRYTWSVIANKYFEAVISTKPQPAPVFDFELPLALRSAF